MSFQGVIYFNGPKTQWSGRIDEEEIIAQVSSRYHWFARWLTRSAYGNLDPSRCGYAVLKDGATLEHVEAITSIQ